MSSPAQSSYISDLAVLKTKEFKEVKELLLANGVVSDKAEIVKNAQSIAEITAALTDSQASQFIDVLIAAKEPARARVYSQKRIEGAIAAVDEIKAIIDSWDFS